MKNVLFIIFLLVYAFDCSGQAFQDSLSIPNKILVIKKKEIPIDDSTDLSFIKVNWLITQKLIKDEKSINESGNKNGTLYIYLKKRYYKKVKKALGIK